LREGGILTTGNSSLAKKTMGKRVAMRVLLLKNLILKKNVALHSDSAEGGSVKVPKRGLLLGENYIVKSVIFKRGLNCKGSKRKTTTIYIIKRGCPRQNRRKAGEGHPLSMKKKTGKKKKKKRKISY